MSEPSRHLVLIPTYNTGPRLAVTVRDALAAWPEVWVVVDGSTDGSDRELDGLQRTHAGLRVLRRGSNGGKGAAVLTALGPAHAAGFTHVLVLDADGQHPIECIREFIERSRRAPAAMVLGRPVFGPEAPWERLWGRKLSIGLTHLETLGRVVADPLFGFRVYPIEPLQRAFAQTRAARRYDFDPEIVVRLCWEGVPVVNQPAPCRYLSAAQGGVSHFHYLRDNLRMAWLHLRLLPQLAWRWPTVRRARRAARQVARPAVPPVLSSA